METPFSDSGGSSEAPPPSSAPRAEAVQAPPIDREATEFLESEVLPRLRPAPRRAIRESLACAPVPGSLEPLGALPASQRRALLEAIESRVEARAHPPSPRVLVRLISTVSGAPDPAENLLARQFTSPAR